MYLAELSKLYIKNTREKEIVTNVEIVLCSLTIAVTKICSSVKDAEKSKVYINTKILKHLYDKKPAEEYDFLLTHLHQIVKYPDHIYSNSDSKRGDYIFKKSFDGDDWICSVEKSDDRFFVVTGFRLRKASYLNNNKLIWSWKDGLPSS